MEKQKLSPKSIINIIRGVIVLFVLLICILSPLAFFLAYFMFKNSVNATTEFFLRWTCASILTVTIGVLLQFIASLMGDNDFPAEKRILVVFVAAIGQSLIMTYLFATYQPGPDQMSRIYMLSWILSTTIIHTLWVWGCDFKNTPYEAISRSIGINFAQLSKLVMPLSAFGASILWITIATLMVRQ